MLNLFRLFVNYVTERCVISAESVNYVSTFSKPRVHVPQFYNPNNRNHPNFSWSNQNQPLFQQQQYGRNCNPPGFQQNSYQRQSQSNAELDELRRMVKSLAMSQKALESQIGQLVGTMMNTSHGMLPINTEANPKGADNKEHVNAIGLRSGKVLDEVFAPKQR